MLLPGDGMTYIQLPPQDVINPLEYTSEQWNDFAKLRHACMFETIHIDPKESEVFAHDVPLPPDARYVQLYTQIACARTDPMPYYADDAERPTDDFRVPDTDACWYITTLIDLNALRPAVGVTTSTSEP